MIEFIKTWIFILFIFIILGSLVYGQLATTGPVTRPV